MLMGTADVGALAVGAAEVPEFRKTNIEFVGVTCLQMSVEMRGTAREAVLPPSLHPTIPPALTLQVFQIEQSEWGPFRFACVRVSCRSGVRARGFTTGAVVDVDAARAGLRAALGVPAVAGTIRLRHGYDGVSALVTREGASILKIEGIDPEPLGNQDVQYTGTLNLARTPNGLRLMQIESHDHTTQVERLQARLIEFDGAAWGNELLVPASVITATIATLSLEYPPVRFVCRPEELAFTGTEAVT